MIARRIVHLVRELAPPVGFFFAGLMLILLLFKLFVAQYSVEFYAFSKAAVGALILGKAVLVMDWFVSGRRLGRYPRAVAVGVKTFLYGIVVLLLGAGDRLVHAWRATGGLKSGVDLLIARSDLNRFFGFVLLISVMVGSYMVLEEIDHAIGKGELLRLFFSRKYLQRPMSRFVIEGPSKPDRAHSAL
jgi:hypothetical protein